MPCRIFDQETAKGFIKNSFLKFGRREFQWMVLEDVFQKYSCMGHLQEKKELFNKSEILDDRNGCNTQKKSIGNKYKELFNEDEEDGDDDLDDSDQGYLFRGY